MGAWGTGFFSSQNFKARQFSSSVIVSGIPKKVQKSADLNFFTTEITEHTEKKLSPKSTNSFL